LNQLKACNEEQVQLIGTLHERSSFQDHEKVSLRRAFLLQKDKALSTRYDSLVWGMECLELTANESG
jgi:hypothetical protein